VIALILVLCVFFGLIRSQKKLKMLAYVVMNLSACLNQLLIFFGKLTTHTNNPMTKPNPTNPYHCDRPMRRNGVQAKSGAIQYRCKCGFTCTDGDRPAHRPLLGDEPLTQVERNRRYRAKKKANLN
jgi:hypothetical protein